MALPSAMKWLAVAVLVSASVITMTQGQFEWFQKDKFDEIWRKIHMANAQSCVTARYRHCP